MAFDDSMSLGCEGFEVEVRAGLRLFGESRSIRVVDFQHVLDVSGVELLAGQCADLIQTRLKLGVELA